MQRGAAKFPEWSCKARVVLDIKSHNRKAKTHLSLEYERKFDAIGLGWGCERFGTLKVINVETSAGNLLSLCSSRLFCN